MAPLLDALSEVDSRLDTGLTNPDYGTALGDVSVEYNKLELDRLSDQCVDEVGVALEDAFNAYIEAGNRWDRCIEDTYCDVDLDALPQMRRQWSKASDLIADARSGLEGLDPRKAR